MAGRMIKPGGVKLIPRLDVNEGRVASDAILRLLSIPPALLLEDRLSDPANQIPSSDVLTTGLVPLDGDNFVALSEEVANQYVAVVSRGRHPLFSRYDLAILSHRSRRALETALYSSASLELGACSFVFGVAGPFNAALAGSEDIGPVSDPNAPGKKSPKRKPIVPTDDISWSYPDGSHRPLPGKDEINMIRWWFLRIADNSANEPLAEREILRVLQEFYPLPPDDFERGEEVRRRMLFRYKNVYMASESSPMDMGVLVDRAIDGDKVAELFVRAVNVEKLANEIGDVTLPLEDRARRVFILRAFLVQAIVESGTDANAVFSGDLKTASNILSRLDVFDWIERAKSDSQVMYALICLAAFGNRRARHAVNEFLGRDSSGADGVPELWASNLQIFEIDPMNIADDLRWSEPRRVSEGDEVRTGNQIREIYRRMMAREILQDEGRVQIWRLLNEAYPLNKWVIDSRPNHFEVEGVRERREAIEFYEGAMAGVPMAMSRLVNGAEMGDGVAQLLLSAVDVNELARLATSGEKSGFPLIALGMLPRLVSSGFQIPDGIRALGKAAVKALKEFDVTTIVEKAEEDNGYVVALGFLARWNNAAVDGVIKFIKDGRIRESLLKALENAKGLNPYAGEALKELENSK